MGFVQQSEPQNSQETQKGFKKIMFTETLQAWT